MGGEERDPLRASLWTLGTCPRELLLKTLRLLIKILINISDCPEEAKYRSLRPSNPMVKGVVDTPGALPLLHFVGFVRGRGEVGGEEEEEMLVLPPSSPMGPLEDALAQLRRVDALVSRANVPSLPPYPTRRGFSPTPHPTTGALSPPIPPFLPFNKRLSPPLPPSSLYN